MAASVLTYLVTKRRIDDFSRFSVRLVTAETTLCHYPVTKQRKRSEEAVTNGHRAVTSSDKAVTRL